MKKKMTINGHFFGIIFCLDTKYICSANTVFALDLSNSVI